MGFLPKDFKNAISNSKYWKLKDMPQGESRFRIVGIPISGWVDWKNERPYRYRHENRPKNSFDPEKPMKAFVACHVWDYARKGLYILEFTQKTIIVALDNLYGSEDWGDITLYDLKLIKEGSGQKVKYSLSPVPHKPISAEIKEALKGSPVNLDALFSGGDPWNWTDPEGLSASIVQLDDEDDGWSEVINPKSNKEGSGAMTPMDELREHLLIDDIPTDRLEEWVKKRALTKNSTVEAVLKACLDKDVLPGFKRAFVKYITPDVSESLAV